MCPCVEVGQAELRDEGLRVTEGLDVSGAATVLVEVDVEVDVCVETAVLVEVKVAGSARPMTSEARKRARQNGGIFVHRIGNSRAVPPTKHQDKFLFKLARCGTFLGQARA
jgi:hypothetical protein